MTKGGKGKSKARHTRTSKKGKVFFAGKGVKIYTPKENLMQKVKSKILPTYLFGGIWDKTKDRIVEIDGQKYTLKEFGDGGG